MNEYSDRQRRRDAQYAEAWKALTPEQREEYARLGIKGPELPRYETYKRECDTPEIAEAIAERNRDHGSAFLSHSHEWDEDETQPSLPEHDNLESLRQIIGVMLSTQQTRLSIECIALLLGLAFEGDSMTAIARKHRVTRAAVSKRCIELAEKLGIQHSRAMRTLTARRNYAQAQNSRLH